jgi:hypothetical protein
MKNSNGEREPDSWSVRKLKALQIINAMHGLPSTAKLVASVIFEDARQPKNGAARVAMPVDEIALRVRKSRNRASKALDDLNGELAPIDWLVVNRSRYLAPEVTLEILNRPHDIAKAYAAMREEIRTELERVRRARHEGAPKTVHGAPKTVHGAPKTVHLNPASGQPESVREQPKTSSDAPKTVH